MGQIVPDLVEAYLASLTRAPDPLLEEVEQQGKSMALPILDRETGALLRILARVARGRRVLEIGTAIGYSGLWLAGALPPDGRLLTIEIDPGRAAMARANFARAGLDRQVTVMIGDAARLVHKVSGPFDLIFNDGDKRQYEPLLDRLVGLLRPGGLLVTDNVLWNGDVVPGFQPTPTRPVEDTRAIGSYNRRLAADARVHTAFLPIRDGLAVSIRADQPASEPSPG